MMDGFAALAMTALVDSVGSDTALAGIDGGGVRADMCMPARRGGHKAPRRWVMEGIG